MAKKESVKSKIKSVYEKHKEQITAYLMDFLETGGRNLLEWLKEVAKIKEKIKKVIISTGLVLAALVVILIGLATYLSTLVPNLPAGLMHVIVGVVAMILAWIYVKI
jgi:fatty acid desaturase